MPEEKLKIQWEDLSERLQSEALKCLLCSIMQKYAPKEGVISALAHACTYMTRALTTRDNDIFEKEGPELLEHLEAYLKGPATEAKTKFMEAHIEYIKDRTEEVIDRAVECLKSKQRK